MYKRQVLAYQVDQVKVVEPEHTEDLEIIPGGDYCTLVTCTPYAINTHRMLVRGVRVPYNGEDEDADTPQAVQYQALNTGNIVKRVVDAWPWISVTGSIITVSYTHLDVYKRQHYLRRRLSGWLLGRKI